MPNPRNRECVSDQTPDRLGSVSLPLVVPHDGVADLDRTVSRGRTLVAGASDEGSTVRPTWEHYEVEPPAGLIRTFFQSVEGVLQRRAVEEVGWPRGRHQGVEAAGECGASFEGGAGQVDCRGD